MPFVLAEPCIDVIDRACTSVCPVACIHFDAGQERKLYIDSVECIDCGACEPISRLRLSMPHSNCPQNGGSMRTSTHSGIEVESNGEVWTVAGKDIILSAGGLKSPHLLLLSGAGPAEALRCLGMPLVHHLPGVGQNLRNHPIASVSMRGKEGVTLQPDNQGTRIALRYTAILWRQNESLHGSDLNNTIGSVASPGGHYHGWRQWSNTYEYQSSQHL